MIDSLAKRFIPVAVDQHIHRRLKDAEGALFAKVLTQAGRGLGGRSQGVYIFAPGGKLLAFSNTADAKHVKRLMRKALDAFQSTSVKIETPHVSTQNSIMPPEDVHIALVTSKVLGGYERVEGRRTDTITPRLWGEIICGSGTTKSPLSCREKCQLA